MEYELVLKKLKDITNLLLKRENIRKKFVMFNRFSRNIFVILISVYSIYLYSVDHFFVFNYGLAWWIVILFLVMGWIGDFILASYTTKLFHKYVEIRNQFSETLFNEYKDSRLRKVSPYVDDLERIRNSEFLTLFEYGFSDYAKEIQETYLGYVNIYLFDISNIHGVIDFLNTDDIPQYIGQKIAQQYNSSYIRCLILNDEETSYEHYIVVYTD